MPEVRDDQLPLGAGTADEVPPRPAASVIVMRGEPFEVLFLRRTEASTFVPGSWVFPGGTLDDVDREVASSVGKSSDLDVMRICAIRELFEESGVWLGASIQNPASMRRRLLKDSRVFREIGSQAAATTENLTWTSRWITPIGIPKRFDTYFFLALTRGSGDATPEHGEGVEVAWLTPAEALERHARREFPLVFPTIRNLEAIRGCTSPVDLLHDRRDARIETVQPVLVVDGDVKRIVIPGES